MGCSTFFLVTYDYFVFSLTNYLLLCIYFQNVESYLVRLCVLSYFFLHFFFHVSCFLVKGINYYLYL